MNETNTEIQETKQLDPKTQTYINNLQSVVDLPQQARSLVNLWETNRDQFFIDLAHWLEQNLGAHDTSIIYNDIKKTNKEEEKPQLTKTIMTKAVVKEDSESEDEAIKWDKNTIGQAHESLLEQYQEVLKLIPHLIELSETSFTLGGSIKGSPFLVLSRHRSCNSLQQSLLTALFQELGFLTA